MFNQTKLRKLLFNQLELESQSLEMLMQILETFYFVELPRQRVILEEGTRADGYICYMVQGRVGVYKQHAKKEGEQRPSFITFGGKEEDERYGGLRIAEPTKNSAFIEQLIQTKESLKEKYSPDSGRKKSERPSALPQRFQHMPEGSYGTLMRVMEGDSIFGERAIENQTLCSASVVTLSQCQLIFVHRRTFEQVFRANLQKFSGGSFKMLADVLGVRDINQDLQTYYTLLLNTETSVLIRDQCAAVQGIPIERLSLITKGSMMVSKQILASERNTEFYKGISEEDLNFIFARLSGYRVPLTLVGEGELIGEEIFTGSRSKFSITCAMNSASLLFLNSFALKSLPKSTRENVGSLFRLKVKNRIQIFQKRLNKLVSRAREELIETPSAPQVNSAKFLLTTGGFIAHIRSFINAKAAISRFSVSAHREVENQSPEEPSNLIHRPPVIGPPKFLSHARRRKISPRRMQQTFSGEFRINQRDSVYHSIDCRPRSKSIRWDLLLR